MTALLFTGGVVVSGSDTRAADVLVQGERVVAVMQPGTCRSLDDVQRVDATGCYLLPGGVDPHTHFEHRVATGNTRTADDFTSGSIAAACGGTTTVLDFVRAPQHQGIREAFVERRARAEEACAVDFALHPMVPATAGEDDSFEQLTRLAEEEGARSWKFFMAYPGSMVGDSVLIEGFNRCRELGVLPMVHAENGSVVQDAIARLAAQGRLSAGDHGAGHPAISEVEAVSRAIRLAEYVGVDLYIVHVSSADAADEINRLRRESRRRVYAETCPQYLAISNEGFQGLGFGAAAFVCSPPIRDSANQERLWRAVLDGSIETLGTDHAAFTMTQPEALPPQKPAGRDDFRKIPNGLPGAEERLLVSYQQGVVERSMGLSEWVSLVSERPAQIFGLEGKGRIAPGMDADIVIWDPTQGRLLEDSTMHSQAGYTPYAGMYASGSPRAVYSRGVLVAENGKPTRNLIAGRGRYLPQKITQEERKYS